MNANMSPKRDMSKIDASSPLSMSTAVTTTSTLSGTSSTIKNSSPLFSTPPSKIVKSPSSMSSAVAKKLKFSPDKKSITKKPAYLIDFCNRDQVTLECLKYLKHSVDLPLNEELQLTFLLNKFQANDIQASFYQLIGKVGGVAASAFLPMAMRKKKLIDEFLCLIYDHKSMMINTDKNSYR